MNLENLTMEGKKKHSVAPREKLLLGLCQPDHGQHMEAHDFHSLLLLNIGWNCVNVAGLEVHWAIMLTRLFTNK